MRPKLMSLRNYRTKLYIFLPISWLLGLFLAMDVVKVHSHSSSALVYGQVVERQIHANQWGISRPYLTIQINGTSALVHASLSMNSVDEMPDKVSFFYSGDPSREVFLQQETDPLWGALLMFLLPPIGLLMIHFWERRERRRTPGTGSRLSPAPRNGAV